MPNETKYHMDQNPFDKHYFDDFRNNAAFDELEDEPIFTDGIPVLTDKLSAIELQMLRSKDKTEAILSHTRKDRKGLMGGLWLRRKNKVLV